MISSEKTGIIFPPARKRKILTTGEFSFLVINAETSTLVSITTYFYDILFHIYFSTLAAAISAFISSIDISGTLFFCMDFRASL